MLALLAIEGERTGYDLLKLVQQAIAHVWSPARSGLYAVLPRLARERPRRPTARTRSRRGRTSSSTRSRAAGRAALEQWLETVEPGARETFFLKLFVGALTTPEVLLAHVEQFVDDTEARLAELQAIEPTNSNRGHDWFHRHMLRYGIDQAERELAWAAGVARALKRGPR